MINTRHQNGFTMIELLTVVAVIAVLIVSFLFLMRGQQAKAHDAKRKDDLEDIRIAFEDYFNDNACYPPTTILDNCGSKDLDPYLNEVPCDPVSNDPYVYEPVANCAGYRAFAVLDNKTDPQIARLGCDGVNGCGAAAGPEYNYAIFVGVPITGTGVGIASPRPSGPTYAYACDSAGICNSFEAGHPLLSSCPITYQDSLCENACDNPANRCTGF